MVNEMSPSKSNIVAIPFYLADATADASATNMSAAGEATGADVPYVPVPWAGSIVGIGAQVEAERSGGTLTLRPTINGSSAAAAITIDGDNKQYNYTDWRRGLYALTAGQRVGCTWATTSSWSAGSTPSVHVTLYVQIDDP